MIRVVVFFMFWATAVAAVEPDEILDDPALEATARALSSELRCLVCQNESIDESDADVARDLRLLVRERLLAGDTKDEARAYIVDRYGEFVLLRPTFNGSNAVLWLAGPLLALIALLIGYGYTRGRSLAAAPADALSEDEKHRLAQLIDE